MTLYAHKWQRQAKNARLLYHYKHLVVFGIATNSVVCCGLLNAMALKCPFDW